jgi:predicted ATP-grasp superfamily ATP-dependent carboligase
MPRVLDLGGLSKYVSRRIEVPDNRTAPDAWAEAVLDAAGDHDVLVPIGMHSIAPVTQRLAAFRARTRLALAPWDTIARADNTPELLEMAHRLEIPIPTQYRVADYPTLEALAAAVRYPVFVKIGVEAGLPPGERYTIARSRDELRAAITRFARYTTAPIIQEVIAGEGIGFEALYDFEHRLVAAFAHRRLREYPLTGGPSTYCVSIHNPRAAEYGRRLLDHLRWTGLAMVEFKVDARTGTPVLMEINPRPWGSMQLPIRAGVEFPWLAFQLARDGQLPVQPDWPDGVRMRYLVNDLQAALAQARVARSPLAGLAILTSLLDPFVKEGILSLSDPGPSWAYLRKGATQALGSRPRAAKAS